MTRPAPATPAGDTLRAGIRAVMRAMAVPALWAGACGAVVLVPVRAAGADDGAAASARAPIDPWLDRLHRGPESGEPGRLLPWVDELVAAGRARAGTETGALLLAGAASELGRRGAAPAKARGLLEEALVRFSSDDPRSGLLWLDLADVRNDLGDPPGVLDALDRADAVARRPGPRDEAHPGPQLRARLREDLAARGEGLRRHALAAVGRHAEAATLWERRAATTPAGADTAWEWAAEEAWAAGDRERALRNIDAAIASARNDSAAIPRISWKIRASFGQLTERGDAAYRTASISDDLFTAFRAAVRDHGDRPGGFQLALDASTFATAADRTDELLEFLSYAFTSPGFAREAARSLSRRLEIVAGARLALTAGRPEQALAWLRLAEHHHGGPLPHTEGFRLAIEEALRPPDDPRVALLQPDVQGLVATSNAESRHAPRPLPPGDAGTSAPASSAVAASPSPTAPPVEEGSHPRLRGSPVLLACIAAFATMALLLFGPRGLGPRVPRRQGRGRGERA